ncbi:minichromosome maintenance protein MCM [Desulfurococcaceae archaeon MEX13E-LK6-19]|nr:minichromosome maintenance protein MCM [Desulfurococcaceae archaeon MEX13E-LK6-19]
MEIGETTVAQVEGLRIEDIKEKFKEFFNSFIDRRTGVFKYRERLNTMAVMSQRSLVIDFDDLVVYDMELARIVELYPDTAIEAASQAIKELLLKEHPDYAETVEKFYPRFRGLPKTIRIRDLGSEYIGKLVAIEGIVVRMTRVEAKMIKARFKHVDPECGNEFDWPPFGELGERIEKPPMCPICGKTGKFQLLMEKSRFIDWQKIVVQEKPEEIPAGQMPRSIEIILTGDLVDSVRPGDRATVIGILRVLPTAASSKGSGKAVFELYIDANYIDVQQKVLEEIEITREDEEKIKEMARDPWIREKIIASIAPFIYGNWDIKEAIALQLFGGVPKILEDGTRIRGDIHVLLVGDPGIGKSMLLQYAARIAPRAVYTSGKGTTAAGITAAVLRDKQTGEYYLEAGALVIADGGLAVIDEIDKMRPEDRVAIHEAMEQQTISIAKAGIVARLNARAAVLAAGNPKYGRYDFEKTIADNINLPPTILSRFDLIFIMRDVPDVEQDRRMARHILGVHKDVEKVKPVIPPEMLRKYISYARRYVRPRLTEEARKLLEDFYVMMRRSGGSKSPIPITARQLEALVRLAEAHAKMALKPVVTLEDAEEAIRLMSKMLSTVGIDVETGRIDIDTLMVGKPRSQQEKMKLFMEIFDELAKSSPDGRVKIKELVAEAKEKGLPPDFVLKIVKRMLRTGELYEPEPGYIAKVS